MYSWAELLSSKLRKPRWSVEFAPTAWDVPGRSVRTALRTFRPWTFWTGLRMSHEIRWARLAAYVLLLLAFFYVVFCVAQGVLAYGVWSAPRQYGLSVRPFDVFRTMLLPLSSETTAPTQLVFRRAASSPLGLVRTYWTTALNTFGALLMVQLLCPLGFVALPASRRGAKVRWRHIFRITVYGFGLAAPMLLLLLAGTSLRHQSLRGLAVGGTSLLVAAFLYGAAWLPLQAIWWSAATDRFLRMPHAWGVGLAVVMIAGLATAFVVVSTGLDLGPLTRLIW